LGTVHLQRKKMQRVRGEGREGEERGEERGGEGRGEERGEERRERRRERRGRRERRKEKGEGGEEVTRTFGNHLVPKIALLLLE
jgi:hypothetical protein